MRTNNWGPGVGGRGPGIVPAPLRGSASRGGALLMVMWVSAALAAIGFSVASTVRGEVERTGTAVDGLRAYYLAVGGLQRGMVELLWTATNPEKRLIPQGTTVMNYTFPSGVVRLEILPETGKLNVNQIPPVDLIRLLIALGEPEGRAQAVAQGILDWRGTGPSAGGGMDSFSQSANPSFQSQRASIQEIEELLLVRGVTPDLFYGTYVPAETVDGADSSGPRLLRKWGLADCLSVYGTTTQVDANTAAPPVLAAIGLSPFAVNALVEQRKRQPFTMGTLSAFMAGLGAPMGRLRVEGNSMVTMRATARLRLANGQLGDLKRTVAAQMKYGQKDSKASIDILRWYDTAWSE